jgi:hypothetical protein
LRRQPARPQEYGVTAEETSGLTVSEAIRRAPLEEAVFLAIGRASMCWEHPEGAGVFDSTAACEVGDALLARFSVELGRAG